jgi:hypothetical protein
MSMNIGTATPHGGSNFSTEKYSILKLSIHPVQRTVFAFNYNNIYLACLTCIVLTDNRPTRKEPIRRTKEDTLNIIQEKVGAEMSLPEQCRNEILVFVFKAPYII